MAAVDQQYKADSYKAHHVLAGWTVVTGRPPARRSAARRRSSPIARSDTGPALAWGTDPQPGDLVFFGTGPDHVTHVGLYLGDGQMIDAPHTGDVVRVQPYRRGHYLGATRPAQRPTPRP